MPTAVIVPELGESVDKATVTAWLKSVGDTIEELEPLLEVETDKATTEFPSPASGTVLRILAHPNQVIRAGMILAWIGEPGEKVPGDSEAVSATEGAQSEPEAETGLRGVLQQNCPGCGAPTHPNHVRWHSAKSAECLFCGASLKVGHAE